MKKISGMTMLCVLIWAALPLSAQEGESFDRIIDIDGDQPVQLEFIDVDGSLTFSTWDRDQVEIHIRKEVRVRDPKRAARLLEETRIDLDQRGNSIRLEVKYPRIRGFVIGIHDTGRIEVTTEIRVPVRTDLRCRTEDGAVRGSGLHGEADIKTEDGSIRLSLINGAVTARSEDGRMILENITGSVQAESEDGDITLSGKIGQLRLETEDGDIEADALSGSSMETDWWIESEDGDVDISLPTDISADIYLKTEDGDIDSRIPITLRDISSRNKLTGKLNQGGPLLTIKTQDGDITLRESKG